MGTINRTTAQLNKQLQPAHIHLHLSQPEVLPGDGTNWYSPGTYVEAIELPVNFDYVGGSIAYTGAETIEVLLLSTASMSIPTSATTTVEMTAGKNNTPNLDYIINHVLTTQNDEKELTSNVVVELETGDTLDFFVRSTQSVTLEKAVWLGTNNE